MDYVRKAVTHMAAEQQLVDLRAVAAGCKIPYSTLARWAVKNEWPVKAKVGTRRLYPWDVVCKALEQRAA
jgi:predicted DNA-binding transcriptional regulator AlpA